MNNECIICLNENNLIFITCKSCHGINIHENCFIDLLDNNGDKCPICRGDLVIPDRPPFIEPPNMDRRQFLCITRFSDIRECHRLKMILVVTLLMILSYMCGYCITILGCFIFYDTCNVDITMPFRNPYFFFMRIIFGCVFLIAVSGPSSRRFNRRRDNNSIRHTIDRNALV